jgi:hypothetical protein
VIKQRSPQSGDSLRGDDPRWLPVAEAHRRLAIRLGNGRLAALDLTEALGRFSIHCTDEIRCMRRSTVDGGWQAVRPTFWVEHELSGWSDGLFVIRRRGFRDPRFPDVVVPLRWWVFYVWRPDFEKQWPPDDGAKDEPRRR